MLCRKSLILIGLLYLNCINGLPGKKSWTYDMKSVETKTSDSDKMDIDVRVERVSRGVFALSGTANVNFDVTDIDQVKMETFRSDSPTGVYKSLPFKVAQQHIYEAINGIYKNLLMESLKQCSDLPVFDDKFEPPLEKKIYTLDKCQFNTDNFPNHLQEGFYKILVSGYGQVDWSLEILAEVEMAV